MTRKIARGDRAIFFLSVSGGENHHGGEEENGEKCVAVTDGFGDSEVFLCDESVYLASADGGANAGGDGEG